jgi:hypothetical protein
METLLDQQERVMESLLESHVCFLAAKPPTAIGDRRPTDPSNSITRFSDFFLFTLCTYNIESGFYRTDFSKKLVFYIKKIHCV